MPVSIRDTVTKITSALFGEKTQTVMPIPKQNTAPAADTDAERQNRFAQGTIHTAPDTLDTPDGGDNSKNALTQFVNWQGNVLERLGLTSLTGNVKADNPTLVAALATIAAAGAPEPKIVTETIAWPGGDILAAGAFTVDVYTFYRNGKTARLTEFLLAANPQIAINELRQLGIITA